MDRAAAIEPLELERIAARGWPGLRAEWRHGWLLRAGGGWTGRANSALPAEDPEVGLDEMLALVRAWYVAEGLPPMIQVPLPVREQLRRELLGRGWTDRWGAVVMTAEVDDVLARVRRRDLPPIRVTERPDAAWLAAYHYRGGALPAVASAVLRAGSRPRFLAVVEDTGPTAICRVALDGEWVGITAVEVLAAHRRRGLATHLLVAALELARAEGARCVYLQMEDGNLPARQLYRRAGFVPHHIYRYHRPADV